MQIAEANPAAMKQLLEGANLGPTIHEYPLALTSFQITVIQIRLLREGKFKIKKAFGGDKFFSQPLFTLFELMCRYHLSFLMMFNKEWKEK